MATRNPSYLGDPISPTRHLPNTDAYVSSARVETIGPNTKRIHFSVVDVEEDNVWVLPQIQFNGDPIWLPGATSGLGEPIGPFMTLAAGIEYAIDFVKSNGKQSRKIFKISESGYSGQTKEVSKEHSFKRITTRKYYPGIHGIAIVVNGHELARGDFRVKK